MYQGLPVNQFHFAQRNGHEHFTVYHFITIQNQEMQVQVQTLQEENVLEGATKTSETFSPRLHLSNAMTSSHFRKTSGEIWRAIANNLFLEPILCRIWRLCLVVMCYYYIELTINCTINLLVVFAYIIKHDR